MELLRGQHLLEIPPYLDYRNMGRNTQACFINIRSLNKHAADLANDYNFQNRYLTITAETNMQPRTDIKAIGKTHTYRAHTYRVETIMPPAKHGISVFAKAPVNSVSIQSTETMESISVSTTYPIECTFIGV